MRSIRLFSLCLIAAGLMFQGCAAKMPTHAEMKEALKNYTLPKTVESGKALVYVLRPSPLGTLIRFNVFLDDQEDESEMGYTRGSQYIYFNVSPGPHTIMSKAENWAEISVDPTEGEIVFIQQNPEMGFIMARNSLFPLQKVEGKYRVKNLDIGTIKKIDK